MRLKPHQFICPDCLQVTDKGGTGRRKRCPACAAAHTKVYQKAYAKENNFYEYKRGPHTKLKGVTT